MFNLVPQPNELILTGGKRGFVLSEQSAITPLSLIKDFREFVKSAFSVRLRREAADENAVLLHIEDDFPSDEGYELTVQNGCVHIAAKTENGLFYGLQTLKQLLLQSRGILPELKISDTPRFPYRGFMLDCGRRFYTVDEIKRLIDLAALHKFNVFHWRLTEDRCRRGGFYTQENMREIVCYCHSRFMKVIPEIDVLGHNTAALARCPELGCSGRQPTDAAHLCAGKEAVFSFAADTLDELLEIFTDGYIHLGGNEAVKMHRTLCPDCELKMHELKLSSEEQLQHWFLSRISRYLREKNCRAILWNYGGTEDAAHLEPDILWQISGADNKHGLLESEIQRGRKLIFSDAFTCCLDLPYGCLNLKQAYEGVPEQTDDAFVGAEAPLWTEYVPNLKKAERLVFPRLGAIAESAWSQDADRSFDRFFNGLSEYYDLLNVYHVRYATLSEAMPGKTRAKLSSFYPGAKRAEHKAKQMHTQFK